MCNSQLAIFNKAEDWLTKKAGSAKVIGEVDREDSQKKFETAP